MKENEKFRSKLHENVCSYVLCILMVLPFIFGTIITFKNKAIVAKSNLSCSYCGEETQIQKNMTEQIAFFYKTGELKEFFCRCGSMSIVFAILFLVFYFYKRKFDEKAAENQRAWKLKNQEREDSIRAKEYDRDMEIRKLENARKKELFELETERIEKKYAHEKGMQQLENQDFCENDSAKRSARKSYDEQVFCML